MIKQEFKQMADLIVESNCKFPFSGEIVNFAEKRIKKIVNKEPTFNALKWDRYIATKISKIMVRKKLKEGELCGHCLGKGYFEQSHDGMGRELTCSKCNGTGLEEK